MSITPTPITDTIMSSGMSGVKRKTDDEKSCSRFDFNLLSTIRLYSTPGMEYLTQKYISLEAC